MEIQLWDKDIKLIADNIKMGGGSHTALEIALARKVLNLQKTLAEANEKQQHYFDALYAIGQQLKKTAGERIQERAKKDLEAASKQHFAKAVKLNEELQKTA